MEDVGSAMASMPHYMAGGVNELSAAGIEKAINGLMQMLILTITGVEELVVFIINLLTQTYVCLITLVVGGSLHAAIAVAEDVGNFLNSTVKDIGKEISDAAAGFQDTVNSVLGGLDDAGHKIEGIFGGGDDDSKPPKIDFTSEIDKLDSLQLPADYDKDLKTLNDNIPTFAQVNNFTNNAIKWPFEKVKQLLNESLPKYTMDRSLFPVPAKETLTFCSDNNGISDFFVELVKIEQLAKKIFLVTLVILAILAMIPMAWWEIHRYKRQKKRAALLKSEARDPMDAVYIVSRHFTSSAGIKLAGKFKSKRRQTLVRWSVAYATTVPALFVLSLAIAGLLGCLCQYILLKTIEKEVPKLENEVLGFADKVVDQLNNASQQWAVGTNDIITHTNDKINDDVLGWVNETTHAVNNTLNVFVDGVMDVLNTTFGGTVLYDPVLDVLNCLILLKIQGIEKGLTWVSDHAYIDFPLLPNDTFSLGTLSKISDSQTDILAAGPNNGATDAITGAVGHVIHFIQQSIQQEAIISTCVLLIWVIIALIGITRGLILMYRGGDDGLYDGTPPTSTGLATEKYELNNLPRVPTYEQATQDNRSVSYTLAPSSMAERRMDGDNSANRYNGQVYTLTPHAGPTLDPTCETSPIMHTGFLPPNEKLGSVNGQNVDAAIRRPTHIRASSHGDYMVTSPTSGHPQNRISTNYLQSIDQKRNPFADPVR